MTTYAIVRTEHLNHRGFLFGGQMLKWVDEFAWIAAMEENPGCSFVTRAMDGIDFTNKVANGAILRFDMEQCRRGATSIAYRVDVCARQKAETEPEFVFSTRVTLVNVDENGCKKTIA